MSFGKQSPPPAPNFTGAAQTQANNALNLAQNAQASSNYNQQTPYGSTTYSNTPQFDQQAYDQAMQQFNANPSMYGGVAPTREQFTHAGWTVTQNLTPEQQAILQSGQGLQQQMQGIAGQAFGANQGVLNNPTVDTSQLPSLGINPGQTYYDAMLQMQQPQIQRMTEQTNQDLANRGIPIGSEAWKLAQSQLGSNLGKLYAGDVTQGMGMGLQANQQAFGQQQQNIQNRLNALQTGAGLYGAGSNVTLPGQVGVQGAQMAAPQPANLADALAKMYGIQLGNVNARNAQTANTFGQLGQLGGMYMLGGL